MSSSSSTLGKNKKANGIFIPQLKYLKLSFEDELSFITHHLKVILIGIA